MTDNNINLYISSKNRVDGDASSFSVVVPNGLISCKKNENWKLNVNGFYLINSWYNIKSNYNNHFVVIYNSISYDIYLTEGSPNVYELLQDLNEKLATYMTVSYNRAKNKFTYKNNNATPCRIIPITAGDFLGFENFTDTNIDTLGVESDDPINVQGDKMLFVKLYASDFTLANNSIDNLFTGDYLPNTIIFSVPINVPPQSLISYNNEDGGNSFTHLITQSRDDIDHFSNKLINILIRILRLSFKFTTSFRL